MLSADDIVTKNVKNLQNKFDICNISDCLICLLSLSGIKTL